MHFGRAASSKKGPSRFTYTGVFPRTAACAEFRLFERWIDRFVSNWAHCDGVATWLIAASIANEPSLMDLLPPWTRSSNRWKRRAAAVSFLQEGKHGRNTERILEISESLLEDPDDMVQKGVGWLLKETYPSKPREVVSFLASRRTHPSRLLLRYAAEKMSPADRGQVLQTAGQPSNVRRKMLI